jgi:small subunit ribosomal protein S1
MSEQQNESFADLFDASAAAPAGRRFSVGDRVTGQVAHIGQSAVIVDLDGKQQGFLELPEVLGPDGAPSVKLGEAIDVVVVSIEGDQIRVGKGLGGQGGPADIEMLRVALEGGVPVEGKVVGVNKGGLAVEVGGLRCFCPSSQIDVRFVEDKSRFLNEVCRFVVTEIKGRDVVLSRRALLEEEAKAARAGLLDKLQPGTRVHGKVTRVREFGAFVDLGGIEGLIPTRELSHERKAPEAVVSTGDVVEVVVQKLEQEAEGDKVRITLSLKALASDPWDGIDALFRPGEVVPGQVSRLADFGAFVRLAAGIEGLLHVSELGARVQSPSEVLSVGQQVMVVAKSIDREKHRIGLTLAEAGAVAGSTPVGAAIVVGKVVKGTVERHERFGVFVQLEGTRGRDGRGLIPNAELGVAHGVDLRKEFPLGTEVTAKVLETGSGRLRLSIKAALDDAERADFDSFRQSQASAGKLGSFGDLLKAKLKP